MEAIFHPDRSVAGAPTFFRSGTDSPRREAAVCLFMILALLQAGCDLFPDDSRPGDEAAVSVMARNVYVGANVATVIGADPEMIPAAVAQFYATVQTTDFPERAKAIADEIAAARPDLIGLQEVALYRLQNPGDYLAGQLSPNATEVAQDFLAILMDELDRRHLTYRVVNEVINSDIELPGTTDGVNFFDLRLTDRDVILARQETRITASESHQFTTNLPLPLNDAEGNPIPLLRGFGIVQAEVRGLTFTFANTHLETPVAPPVQVAQATELVDALDGISGPVVLVGDFNSAAPGAATNHFDTDTYGLLAAHFTDAFAAANPGDPGYTCCQAADLLNSPSQLTWRIDHIWHADAVEVVRAARVGEDAADRTPSGFWPSDHAGVTAVLQIDVAE